MSVLAQSVREDVLRAYEEFLTKTEDQLSAAILTAAAAWSSRADPNSLWDIQRAARFLGVHATTVRQIILDNDLPYVRIGKEGRGSIRLRPEDVSDYLERIKQDTSAETASPIELSASERPSPQTGTTLRRFP